MARQGESPGYRRPDLAHHCPRRRGRPRPLRDGATAGTATLGPRQGRGRGRRHLICGTSVHARPGEQGPSPYTQICQISFRFHSEETHRRRGDSPVGSIPGRGPTSAAGVVTLVLTSLRIAGAADQISSTPVGQGKKHGTESYRFRPVHKNQGLPAVESVRKASLLRMAGPCRTPAHNNPIRPWERSFSLSQQMNVLFFQTPDGPKAKSSPGLRRSPRREAESKSSEN